MRIVSTLHHSSSVSSSVTCRLSPDAEFEHLAIAKTNRVEIFSLRPEGLREECGQEIWGRVVALRAIPVAEGSDLSNLLVLTDHPHSRLIVLAYSLQAGKPSLVTKSYLSLHDRHARHAEFLTDVVVHPSGKVAVVSCYAGKLKVLMFKNGQISEHFDASVPEISLLAFGFLHAPPDVYTLALLHIDYQQRTQLLSRDLDVDEQELSPHFSTLLPNTMLPTTLCPITDTPPMLISIPDFPLSSAEGERDYCLGGVLVIGGRKILFFELASQERQDIKREKQRRLEKRKSSSVHSESTKAKEKEKEREQRKVKPKASLEWPWSEVTAWCTVDAEKRKFFLGDLYGRLSMLMLDSKAQLVLMPLGETSSPTSLSYLSSQVLYVGSHTGESQLLRIHPSPYAALESRTLPIPSELDTISPIAFASRGEDEEMEDWTLSDTRSGTIVKGRGTYIELLDTYQNIAPIMDAVLADIDGSAQPQIVTCSGGYGTGALNVIRTGADFHELAVIRDMPNIQRVWPIRSRFDESIDSHLLISTLHASHLLRVDGYSIVTRVDASAAGFATDLPTLALSNVPHRVTTVQAGRTTSSYEDSSLVIQVTPDSVRLVEYDPALGLFVPVGESWKPNQPETGCSGREIVAASVNASQFVLALSGGRLVLLNLCQNNKFQMLKYRDFQDALRHPREIAAVSCAPFDSTKKFATHIGVSFWDNNAVALLSLEKTESYMGTVCESAPLPSLPRSLLLCNFGNGRKPKDPDFHPFVTAGCVDGTVVSFNFRNGDLQDKKIMSLGNSPVSLSSCHMDGSGAKAVFASGSRSALFYWDRQRLRQSAIMLKDVVVGGSLNTPDFPSSLILATTSSLIIGELKGVDKMQIRTISLGADSPRRIAHHTLSNTFGVACQQTTAARVGESESSRSSFVIFDGTSFTRLSQFICEPDEEVTAVRALTDGSRTAPYFCVGTVRNQPGVFEPTSGRLLLFAVQSESGDSSASSPPSLRLLASQDVTGCVYALASVGEFVAAAVNTSVTLFRINISERPLIGSVEQVSQWDHNYFVTSLVSRGNTLMVGDAISSVSVLEVAGTHLQSVARDYGPLWPVAVEAVGEKGVIGANSDCNLFTFSLQSIGSRTVLERDGSFYVDDVINKFIPNKADGQGTPESRLFTPEQLFFTASGRIGLISYVHDEISLPLTALQRNMAKAIHGPGGAHHTQWRAPANMRGTSDAEPSFGFLDGDFLELFLAHPDPGKLLAGDNEAERIDLSRGKVEEILEQLQSLH